MKVSDVISVTKLPEILNDSSSSPKKKSSFKAIISGILENVVYIKMYKIFYVLLKNKNSFWIYIILRRFVTK